MFTPLSRAETRIIISTFQIQVFFYLWLSLLLNGKDDTTDKFWHQREAIHLTRIAGLIKISSSMLVILYEVMLARKVSQT